MTTFLLRRLLGSLLVLATLCLSPRAAMAAIKEYAVVETSKGTLEFELWSSAAPRTVRNFKYLSYLAFYNKTAFHRLIPGFMVQGGDPFTADLTKNPAYFGTGGPGYTLDDEFSTDVSRAHVRGVISMANSGSANSGGSQFFILFGTAAHLDGKHTSFGKLTSVPANEITLAALEGEETELKPKLREMDEDELSKPKNRLEITSIRVRTEVTAPDTVKIRSGVYNGPLRGFDAADAYKGIYNITVATTGAFSGTIQYYGRTNKISGKLVLSANSLVATYSTVLDPSAKVPLLLELSVQAATANNSNVMTVILSDANQSATDRNSTLCYSVSEAVVPSTLAAQYNIFINPPLGSDDNTLLVDLRGYGYLKGSVNRATGLMTIVGKLADGTTVTASKTPVFEGGRHIIPLWDYQLRADTELDRPGFANVPMGLWAAKMAKFRIFELSRIIELPSEKRSIVDSDIYWQRTEKITGIISSEISGYPKVYATRYASPAKGKMLSPFTVLAPIGRLAVGSGALEFTLSTTNVAKFSASANSYSPTLKIDTVNGVFTGSYKESVGAKSVTRTFSGVLANALGESGTVFAGFGYVLDGSGSQEVFILAGSGQ